MVEGLLTLSPALCLPRSASPDSPQPCLSDPGSGCLVEPKGGRASVVSARLGRSPSLFDVGDLSLQRDYKLTVEKDNVYVFPFLFFSFLPIFCFLFIECFHRIKLGLGPREHVPLWMQCYQSGLCGQSGLKHRFPDSPQPFTF